MQFRFTPDEAQSVAAAVAADLTRERFRVRVEEAIDPDAPYRTTILASKGGKDILIECQGTPAYLSPLQRLASWLNMRGTNAELLIATKLDASVSGRLIKDLRHDGVGLIFIGEAETIEIHLRARNPALVVRPDPSLALGTHRLRVAGIFKTFNEGDRKAAVREMAELVEHEWGLLVRRAATKGWFTKSAADIAGMQWHNQLTWISGAKAASGPESATVFDRAFLADVTSFKGGRNVVSHPAKNRWGESKRERQFSDRMLLGARLLGDLVSRHRKVK